MKVTLKRARYQGLNVTSTKNPVSMNSRNVGDSETYIIDLCKIKGRGEFPCPKCGTKISPDDTSEDTYTILETQAKQDHLDKVVLQCNKCKSKLQLIGFETTEHVD